MLIHNEDNFENISLENYKIYRTTPFDPKVLEFLNTLSKLILKNKKARAFPDLITFGFFCRKSNLIKNKERYLNEIDLRLGYGLALHISPSNIPINFAFSFIFGLLSGNSNFIRLPSKKYDQNILLLEIIESLFSDVSFKFIKKSTIFFHSERNSPQLKKICELADCLIVWGGDKTVDNFKIMQKKPGCAELYFPNRVSSLLIKSDAFIEEENKALVLENFYNDTYLVDQNACSSPSNIFWLGNRKSNLKAQNLFWEELNKMIEKKNYSLDTKMIFDKYMSTIEAIKKNKKPIKIKMHNKHIWEISKAHNISDGFNLGLFSSTNIQKINDMMPLLRDNEQTLTYFGCSPKDIVKSMRETQCKIDRIVPIGSALDIGFIWDGKDVVRFLSRFTQLA